MTERRESRWEPDEDICAGCGLRTSASRVACADCGCIRADRSGTFYLAPRLRRLSAYILDVAGLGIAGFVATALLGDWVDNEEGVPTLTASDLDGLLSSLIVLLGGVAVWSLTMRKGQSPGMRLVGIYVRRLGGAVPAPPRFLFRDLWPFALGVLVSLVSLVANESADSVLGNLGFAFGAAHLLSGAWVLWQPDRRALHDMVFDTVVVEMRQRPFSQSPGPGGHMGRQ